MLRQVVHRLAWIVLQLLFVSDCVQGRGHLSLRLLSLTHTNGLMASNQCCDGGPAHHCPPSSCEPYFVITIVEVNSATKGINVSFEAGPIPGAEVVNFTDSIGNTQNPLNSTFNYWPGSVRIKIDVRNAKSAWKNADGFINSVEVMHTQDMSINDESRYTLVAPLTDNSTMEIRAEINLRCDVDCQYDSYCFQCCVPTNNATGHTECDQYGTLYCLPGWKGSPDTGCLEPVCSPPCGSHSTCQPHHIKHKCVCDLGFTPTGTGCQPLPSTPIPTTATKTTQTTTTTTTAKPTTVRRLHEEQEDGWCNPFLCYILIPLVCLLAMTALAIIATLITYYVKSRKEKRRETKVMPFRSLDF